MPEDVSTYFRDRFRELVGTEREEEKNMWNFTGLCGDPEISCCKAEKRLNQLETQYKLGGIWERIENAYGELEGFICGCGHQDQAATNYCSNCGRKMSGGEKK